MTLRSRLPWGVLLLFLWGTAVTLTSAQATNALPAKDIRVTLLGTAGGPRAFVDKAGITSCDAPR